MNMLNILQGDCLKVLPTLEADSVDAVVTDPPYGLGFMGKDWDHGIPGMEFWEATLRVAKPGSHLLAFGGTRTFHRLVCAIEDAGFEIRDTIMWVYGSGFPKSHNLDGDWDGWGTALKPAWEPICVARKPLIGTVAANVAKHGTGALNIDGCRIPASDGVPQFTHRAEPARNTFGDGKNGSNRTGAMDTTTGRWPANVVHDGSDEVNSMFPSTGEGHVPKERGKGGIGCSGHKGHSGVESWTDSGSAARFFYCAKADREDRNDGCDDLPPRDLNWSSGQQSPGTFQSENTDRAAKNFHPTVKPTDLMRWLVRLVTPPGGHVLDPFAGSGSTGRAALLEGFRATLIEIDPAYCAIADRRCRVELGLPL